MAYFNQLQGYMSNLNESLNHENDVNAAEGDKKASTIEDKFNAITQQASGWGGALGTAGIIWKHGRKVVRGVQEASQAATDATTTVGTAAGGGVGDAIAAASSAAASNIGTAGAAFTAGLNSLTATSTAAAATVTNAVAATTATVNAAASQVAGGAIRVAGLPTAAAGGQSTVDAAAAVAANPTAVATPLAQLGLGPGAPLASTTARTVNAATPDVTAAAQTGQVAGQTGAGAAATTQSSVATTDSIASSTASSLTDNVVTQTVGNIAAKVGMDSVLDSIPIIGEVIGVGTLIGGLIHGLDKKGADAREAAARQGGGVASAGGIDTSVFKGNTLGSGGGGYTV